MTAPSSSDTGDPAAPGPRSDVTVGSGFFDDAYHRLIAPFHPETETRHEVAAIREILALAQDDVVLDLGCGWGRHLSLLGSAGHDVVGVDLSYALLRRAADMGDVRDSGARLVAADMRRLPLRDGGFDAVINLATSLGLFLEDGDAVAAMSEARRVLRPGGRLLIEGMHRDDVVWSYAVRDAWTMDDGTEVRVRRRFDPGRAVSHEVLRWDGPAGAGTKRHSLRLRTATEMVSLLDAAALDPVSVYGGWYREPFGRESDRVVLVATR